MKKFKVAFIGAGSMASEHLKAFSSIKEFNICGIYSRRSSKCHDLKKKYKTLKIYDSIKKMYIGLKPDLVIVAINEINLYKVCKEIFKYKWTCLLEKPPGYTFSNYKKILSIASYYLKKNIFVALNRRMYSSTILLKKKINEKKYLKKKRKVIVVDQQEPFNLKGFWPNIILKNLHFANSIHLIDYFNIFCRGDMINIKTRRVNLKKNSYIINSIIKFSSGDIGIYRAFWNIKKKWSVRVSISNIVCYLKPLEFFYVYKRKKKPLKKIKKVDLDFKPGFKLQAKNTLNFLKNKKNNLVSLIQVEKTMSLIQKIYSYK